MAVFGRRTSGLQPARWVGMASGVCQHGLTSIRALPLQCWASHCPVLPPQSYPVGTRLLEDVRETDER
ncbi:hypothetical protein EFN20_03275 [Propionibacterium freudenreichii]|nr:hypothetical protein [Propionibacterium freudenreichii]MCT3008050.1 hypothetical protein [Propionibacterium freudenreichii]MCT3008899.1 hypothetical protein [Propionibacterium freudenreichii]